jgi:hypothetical protein
LAKIANHDSLDALTVEPDRGPSERARVVIVQHFGRHFFNLRQRSLARGILLSVGAFLGSLRLAGFPHIEALHQSNWQIVPLLAAAWGMAETARCLRRKWSLYHAGVLIMLYTDLMILAAIVALMALV